MLPILDNKAFDIEKIRYQNETKTFKNVKVLIERRIETFTGTEENNILFMKPKRMVFIA